MSFKIKFWGVRGSIACPSPMHLGYGGNTSCVEMALGGYRVLFDTGSGIRMCGHWLKRNNINHASLLFSHGDWDHINGLPFFSPIYHPHRSFLVMAGHAEHTGGIRRVVSGQMTTPNFPVPIEAMKAKVTYEDFIVGDSFTLNQSIAVRTAALNHPNGATGYRVDYAGKSACYVTDTEHVPGKPDQNILGLIEGADLVIYDSTYTDTEFMSKIGWGHSTWQEGVRLCQAANVKTLAIFHHDPDHDDSFMIDVEAQARALWPGAIVARDGMRINLA
jgi:phosphoribosyl 1,2-cyclic phosphodiesterase